MENFWNFLMIYISIMWLSYNVSRVANALEKEENNEEN